MIVLACLTGCSSTPSPEPRGIQDPSLSHTLAVPVLSTPPPEFVPLDSALTNRVVVELPGASAKAAITTGHTVVIGDSLTVGARSFLERMAEESGHELQIDAVSGRKTISGVRALKKIEIPLGATVVVALGTNDSNDEQSYRPVIDELMAVVPSSSPVVWLTSYRKKPLDNVARALRDAQSSYPQLKVADWVALLEPRRDWFSADDVHYSPAGYEAFARFVLHSATASSG